MKADNTPYSTFFETKDDMNSFLMLRSTMIKVLLNEFLTVGGDFLDNGLAFLSHHDLFVTIAGRECRLQNAENLVTFWESLLNWALSHVSDIGNRNRNDTLSDLVSFPLSVCL